MFGDLSEVARTEADIVVVSMEGRAPQVVVEFDALDRRIQANCRCRTDEMVVGETVRVRYDRTAPWKTVEQVGNRSVRAWAVFAFIASAVLFVIAMVVLYQLLWGPDGW